MGIQIEDGTGKGKIAGVTNRNQLLTKTITSSSLFEATEDGTSFSATTGVIALTTTASYSGILLLQPSSAMTHVSHIMLASTTTAEWLIKVNSTAGTLFTSGTTTAPVNMNLGSTTAYDGTNKVGADAQTVTDGDTLLHLVTAAYSMWHEDMEDSIMMTPEATLTIECKPTASANVSASVILYNHEEHGGL